MSRMYGYGVTLLGCVIALVSFCLLPYVEVLGTSFTFTGLQLTQLDSHIPLPNYYPYSDVGSDAQGVLLNDTLLIRPIMVLLVLTGAFAMVNVAVAGLWPRQRLIAWLTLGDFVGLGFIFLCSLCSFAGQLAVIPMNAHGNTLAGIIQGSFFTSGFLGTVLGVVVAFIGSVITLCSVPGPPPNKVSVW